MKKLILILLFLGCEGQSQNRIPSQLPSLIVHETISEEMSQEMYERMLTDSTFFYINNDMEMFIETTDIELWYSVSDTTYYNDGF